MLTMRVQVELASVEVTNSISRLDAPSVSSNTNKYLKSNELGYYVAINTWLHIVDQYSRFGRMSLLAKLQKEGLFPVIREAQTAAEELIKDAQIVSSPLFRSIWRDVRAQYDVRRVPASPDGEINKNAEVTMLFILRYLKRFSPLENDLIEKQSITDFLQTENRSKMRQRRGYHNMSIPYIREAISGMLNWDALCNELEQMDITDLEFTSGYAADSKSSLGSKLAAIADNAAEYFLPIFGTPTTGAYNKPKHRWLGRIPYQPVQVSAVPKSYKAARIIAMEETLRQCLARRAFTICDRYTPSYIPLHDQTINQHWALVGSYTGLISTHDLSHASDCITKSFAQEVLPQRFYKLIEPLVGTYTVINGVDRVMQQLSTAGNSLTFWLECVIFAGITLGAVAFADQYGVERECSSSISDDLDDFILSVYGDDIEVRIEYSETLIDFLTINGFISNNDKSFYSSDINYRESCGAEFLFGVDYSTLYYPRFAIHGSVGERVKLGKVIMRDSLNDTLKDSTMALVDLQHKLYHVCYPASRFLYECILEAHPKMTTSDPENDLHADCLGYEDTYSEVYAPAGQIDYYYTVGPLSGVKRKTPHWSKGRQVVGKWIKLSLADHKRRKKYLPSVRYSLNFQLSAYKVRLYEAYKYQNFLKFGPRYDDDLLRLLGISSKPKTLEEVFGEPEIIWALREIDYK